VRSGRPTFKAKRKVGFEPWLTFEQKRSDEVLEAGLNAVFRGRFNLTASRCTSFHFVCTSADVPPFIPVLHLWDLDSEAKMWRMKGEKRAPFPLA